MKGRDLAITPGRYVQTKFMDMYNNNYNIMHQACMVSHVIFASHASSVAKGGALGARAPPLARVTCIVDSKIKYSPSTGPPFILL